MTRRAAARTAGTAIAAALAFSAARRFATRLDLRGRTVLITGGSRGLGLAIARECGQHGARIVLAARDEGELARAKEDLHSRGIQASILTCDLADRAAAADLVRRTVAVCGFSIC